MPSVFFELAEQLLFQGVQWLRWLIEALGALVIAWGLVVSLRSGWAPKHQPNQDPITAMRLSLGRYLALALELQLAADVLSTVLSPTWQDLAKLAAIAAIRTGLNHFLAKESKALRAEHPPG